MLHRDDANRLDSRRRQRLFGTPPLSVNHGICNAHERLSDVFFQRVVNTLADVILQVFKARLLIAIPFGPRHDAGSLASIIHVPVEPTLRELPPVFHRHGVDRFNLRECHGFFLLNPALRIYSTATRANSGDRFIRRSTSSNICSPSPRFDSQKRLLGVAFSLQETEHLRTRQGSSAGWSDDCGDRSDYLKAAFFGDD